MVRTKAGTSHGQNDSSTGLNNNDETCPFDEVKTKTQFLPIMKQGSIVSASESRDDDDVSQPFDEKVALWLNSKGYMKNARSKKKVTNHGERTEPRSAEICNDKYTWSGITQSDPLNHDIISSDLAMKKHAPSESYLNTTEEELISTVNSEFESNFDNASFEDSSLENLVGVFLTEKSKSGEGKEKDKHNVSTKGKASLLEFACGLVLEDIKANRKAKLLDNDDSSSDDSSSGDSESSSDESASSEGSNSSSEDSDSSSSQSTDEVSEEMEEGNLSEQEVNKEKVVPFEGMIPQTTFKEDTEDTETENSEEEMIYEEDTEESGEKRNDENNETLEHLEEGVRDNLEQQEYEVDDILAARSSGTFEENDDTELEQQIEDEIMETRSCFVPLEITRDGNDDDEEEELVETKKDTESDKNQQIEDCYHSDNLKVDNGADELIRLITSNGTMTSIGAPEQQQTADFAFSDKMHAASTTDELIRLIASDGTTRRAVAPDQLQIDSDDTTMINSSIELSLEQNIDSSDDKIKLSARIEEEKEKNETTNDTVLSKDIEEEDMILLDRSFGGGSAEKNQKDKTETVNNNIFLSLSFEEKIKNIADRPLIVEGRKLLASNVVEVVLNTNSNDDMNQGMSEEIIPMDNLKFSNSMEQDDYFNKVVDYEPLSTLMNNNRIILVDNNGMDLQEIDANFKPMSNIDDIDDFILQQREKEELVIEQRYAELIMNNDLTYDKNSNIDIINEKRDTDDDDDKKNDEEERLMSSITSTSINSNNQKESDHNANDSNSLPENETAIKDDENNMTRNIPEVEHIDGDTTTITTHTTLRNEQKCDKMNIVAEKYEIITATTDLKRNNSRNKKGEASNFSSSTSNDDAKLSMQNLVGNGDEDNGNEMDYEDDILNDDDLARNIMMMSNSKSFEVNHFVVVNNKRENTSMLDKIFPW